MLMVAISTKSIILKEIAMNKERYMSIEELQGEGYLQEVNRLFFHRLGLALEVVVDVESGEARLGGVWDRRDDPEGILFTDFDEEKVNRIEERMEEGAVARSRLAACDEGGIQIAEYEF